MIALLLALACDNGKDPADSGTPGGDPGACPAERTVSGTITGTVPANARVAVIDASNWRFGDAPVLSDVVSPDASGAFTLCLEEEPTLVDVYTTGFVAAWVEVDGDDRYDARAEILCDEADPSWTHAYLYYMQPAVDYVWTFGTERTPLGSAAWAPALEAAQCEL